MKILALEPYYGGSHKAFLDGWVAHSKHDWTLFTLPAHKWKWRMRHSAITFADQVCEGVAQGNSWDVLFCSDMLNLAEFLGLAPESIPSIVYFHENQLTYPFRHESERDYQFGMTNITSALAADAVWFNSAYHRDSFLDAIPKFWEKMPDLPPEGVVARISEKAAVHSPGISPIAKRPERAPGPLRILWAARWEHDKNPEGFFEAIDLLETGGLDFRISVIGETFRDAPAVFASAKEKFKNRIDRWGYQESRSDYENGLQEADVIVSTANHEFFGISVIEAIAAGAYPLLPNRLAYPEILRIDDFPENKQHLYGGGPEDLAHELAELAHRLEQKCGLWNGDPERCLRLVGDFHWDHLARELDEEVRHSGR